MPKFGSRALQSALVAALLAAPALGPAQAEDRFPSHPIELIVPTPPGGGTDVAARLLASIAEKQLGQKIIVVDKPGAGGAIGVEEMLQAAPDGYTIAGVWNSPLTITPQMFTVHYKPDSYIPVVVSDVSPLTFCVMKSFPANDGKGLIAALKESPDRYTYGTDGVSGTVHLVGELIFSSFGVKARAIPYGGAGETLSAFMGHSVDIYGGSVPPILPFVQNGTAKCLIVTSAKSNPMLPGAMSLDALGVPQDQILLWHAIIAPAHVPPDRIAVLRRAFQEAARSTQYKSFAQKQGEDAVAWNTAEAHSLIDKEYTTLGGVISALGLAQGQHPSAGQQPAATK